MARIGETGLDAAAIRAQLDEWERVSGFADYGRNWFDEGPHLTSTERLPWGDEARELAIEAYVRFIHGEMWDTGEGARGMQDDIIATMGALYGAGDAAGVLTVGGSESGLCALAAAKARSFAKTFPDLATDRRYPSQFRAVPDNAMRELAATTKSVVLPSYSHYSAFKACALFDLEPIVVPPAPGTFHTVRPEDVRAAIRDDTIAIYGTAGTFPYGTIDPICEMAEIAVEHDIYMHVDACFGGFIIPFLERAGYYDPPIEPWDFRVDGVCSISADQHKNGMAPPPVSSLLLRNGELLEDLKALAPPFGTLTGTRATGPIAGAWTMLARLGIEGFAKVSCESMRLRDQMMDEIANVPGLRVLGESKINLFTFYSDTLDLRPVVADLRNRGWVMSTKSVPAPICAAICTLPQNAGFVQAFVDDIAAVVRESAVPLSPEVQETDDSLYGGIRS